MLEHSIRRAVLAGVLCQLLVACGSTDSERVAAAGTGGQAGSVGAAGDAGQSGTTGMSGSGGEAGTGGAGPVPSQCRATSQGRVGGAIPVPYSRLLSDGRFVYYVAANGSTSFSGGLHRVPVNGGESEELLPSVQTFTLVGTRAFYGTELGEIGEALSPGGTKPLTTGHVALSVASDGRRLMWAEGSATQFSLLQMPLSGGSVSTLAARTVGVGQIKVTADAIWWIESSSATAGSIVRSELDGSSPRTVVADVQGLYEFAVHGATLAIASESGLSLGPTAGGARHDVVTGVPIRGLAIEDETVYFARDDACHPGTGVGNGQPFCKGKFFSVPISGGATRELFASEGQPTELIADSACLYWVQIVGQCHPGCSVSMGVAPR